MQDKIVCTSSEPSDSVKWKSLAFLLPWEGEDGKKNGRKNLCLTTQDTFTLYFFSWPLSETQDCETLTLLLRLGDLIRKEYLRFKEYK